MKDTRTAAAVITATAALLVVLLLVLTRLATVMPPASQPRMTELAEIDEEFVDLFDPAVTPANPRPAYAEQPAAHESNPSPAAGSDLINSGEEGAPVPEKTSTKPSPIKKPQKETPAKTGPDKKAEEAEKARREAQKGVANAFKNTDKEPDNTSAKGKEKGDSGNPDGGASDVNGSGHGTVGGGWIMPSYGKVKSYQTGSIELRAIVGRDGSVKSVELVGGKAPASGDPSLVERCKAEVRRHRFTRTDDNAPETATARITYTFK